MTQSGCSFGVGPKPGVGPKLRLLQFTLTPTKVSSVNMFSLYHIPHHYHCMVTLISTSQCKYKLSRPLPYLQLICKHLFLQPLHWHHPYKLLLSAGVPLNLLPAPPPPDVRDVYFEPGVCVFLDATLLMYAKLDQLQDLCKLMSRGQAKFRGSEGESWSAISCMSRKEF